MSESNIVNYSNDVAVQFHIGTWNINRFYQCDEHEKLKWDNRSTRIAKTIGESNCSIICLQECRKMHTSDANTLFSKPELKYFEHEFFNVNATFLNLRNCILYDTRRWFLIEKGTKWLSSTPNEPSDDNNGFGRIVSFVKLLPVDEKLKILTKVKPLVVFVTHLSLQEHVKWSEVKQLVPIVKEVSRESPAVLCGDMNFFDDKEGGQQRQFLADHFVNLGKHAIYSQSETVAVRTFVPYSYEKDYEMLKNTNSVLDHVFGYNNIQKIDVSLIHTKTYLTKEPVELTSWDDLPSDHMMLDVNLVCKL